MHDLPANGLEGASETELLMRPRSLEPAAWAEIYSLHHRVIYRYVRARVFDDTAAEDVTSSTFLAALQGIRSYRERGRPLLAWLYTIARNKVADHQRRAVRERSFADRLLRRPSRIEPSSANPTVVERLDLRRAIELLPESQREVVLLRHFVGLSTPEISALTGKTAAALYSLEARALVSLRQRLATQEEFLGDSDEKRLAAAINNQLEPMVDRS